MRALSLTQPWASLVVMGAKQFETRSWKTAYKGPLMIHASLKFPADCKELCAQEPFSTALQFKSWTLLPTGAIIGSVNLARCSWTEVVAIEINYTECVFGNYGPNRFAWRLENPILFETPIPCKGALGIWFVPPEVEEAVRVISEEKKKAKRAR